MWKQVCRRVRWFYRERVARSASGQSLVELTLALPVLLILFLGLIELAMALRAYLVLVNANREAARFASRGTFTDEQIAERALISFSGQLPVNTVGPASNTGIIVTRFHVSDDPTAAATFETPIYATGTLTYTSKISPELYAIRLKNRNDDFNADLVASHPDAVRSVHDVVFVEVFYYHHQVLRATIVEWIFPEPIVLYSRTMMRVTRSR